MNEACRPFREQLGSLALGHLDEVEATSVRAHLDGCADCRSESRALEDVARMLPLVDPAVVDEASVAPPASLGERVLSLVREERRLAEKRRRGRLRGALAAAAAVVALVVALVVLTPGDPSLAITLEPEPPLATTSIEAELTAREWGTEIRLVAAGLPAGETYVVWLREPDDDRVPAGSFTATRGSGEIVLASSLHVDDAAGIGVSDAAGETTHYGHLPGDEEEEEEEA